LPEQHAKAVQYSTEFIEYRVSTINEEFLAHIHKTKVKCFIRKKGRRMVWVNLKSEGRCESSRKEVILTLCKVLIWHMSGNECVRCSVWKWRILNIKTLWSWQPYFKLSNYFGTGKSNTGLMGCK
jgi:hypothetical protein